MNTSYNICADTLLYFTKIWIQIVILDQVFDT